MQITENYEKLKKAFKQKLISAAILQIHINVQKEFRL